eukprot:g4114.t1
MSGLNTRNIGLRNDANIGLRNDPNMQRNDIALRNDANIGLRRLVPTRDPSKAQPSLVWIRAFESDLRRRPARRPGPTGSSATSGTWRRELADLARDPPVAPMSPIMPDKQPADGACLLLVLSSVRASASPSGAHTHAAADCKLCKYPATATPSIVWFAPCPSRYSI